MGHLEEVTYFRKQLKTLADPDRAKGEKEYLKSPLQHYGVPVPELRQLVTNWYKEKSDQAKIRLVTKISRQLWASDWHEERTVSILLLNQIQNKLNYRHLPMFEDMANQVTTWAHLDLIAIDLVGAVLEKDRSGLIFLPVWIHSSNFWLRRMAILSQIKLFRVGKGSMTVFKNIVKSQLDEPEYWTKEERFFIRKSIGWALRERSQADPESVVKFVNSYANKLAGLTYREATRKLPKEYLQQLQLAS